MKTLKRIEFLLFAMLCIACFLFPAGAKADETASLTVELKDGETALSGAEFKLYHVGSHLTSEGTIVADEPFASFTFDVGRMTAWDELSEQVDAFVEANDVPYMALETTGANGKAAFPRVEPGLYFVSSTTVQHGDKIYTTLPFLILLPSWDTESESWVYDVTARPKISEVEPAPTPTPTAKPTPASPTPSVRPSHEPHSPRPTALPQTGVDWQPTFWFAGVGVVFLLLCIFTGVHAFRKERKK